MLTGLNHSDLKNKVICEKHFKESNFRTLKRHRLKSDAIPQRYFDANEELKVQTPVKTYSERKHHLLSATLDSMSTPRKKLKFDEILKNKDSELVEGILGFPDKAITPRKIKLKNRICLQVSKLKYYKKRLSAIKQKVQKNTGFLQILPLLSSLSNVAKTFVLMQIRGKKRKQWNLKEREFCVSLYYKSPSTYHFLRRQRIILPSVSSIRRWVSHNLFKTGFDEGIKNILKLKCKAMTQNEKKSVMAFDEISIKSFLEYNKKLDLVEGFEDLGPLGRTQRKATHAVVFSLRGLNKNWKLPISYFFSQGPIHQKNLKQLILYNLENIEEIGFDPRVIVCDQGSNNRGALKLLGVTKNSPFFYFNNKKIFGIFDVPHLFKSIRNNLMTGRFKFEDKIYNFNIIKQTYEIDKASSSARALPKLTDKHINPNSFEKMSCKLALQIFSRAVAAAIRSCVENEQINKIEGLNTADFILTMNNLFDALNSERLYDKNPFRCGISDKNVQVLEILYKGKNIFNSITKIAGRESRPPCFDGMVQTISGILGLFEEGEKDKCFILTKRLNQDFLENFFSKIRQHGGWNLNPSARIFRLSFRIQTITGLIKPSKTSNCEHDNDKQIILSDLLKSKIIKTTHFTDRENTSDVVNKESAEEVDEKAPEKKQVRIGISSLEECAVIYYAGYLLKKTRDKFQCTDCKNLAHNNPTGISLTDPKQIFILQRNYGSKSGLSLVVPSEETAQVVQRSYLLFKKYFDNLKDREFVGSKLKNKLLSHNVRWLGNKNDKCYEHKVFLIEHLVTTNLFKFCKWHGTVKSYSQKVKNLKNQ